LEQDRVGVVLLLHPHGRPPLARKLLVAFWKYVTFGVLIEGAAINAA